MEEEKIPYAPSEEDEDTPAPGPKKLPPNIPALIVAAILVIVVVWGLAHLATLARPWFSSLIPKPGNKAPAAYPTAVISNKPIGTAVAPTSPARTAKPAPRASAPATPPDLSVHILDIGVIDPATGNFINRAPTSPDDMAAVRFDIANAGGSSTGQWHFSASLPMSPSAHAYQSPAQEPLGPGDHIVNTLRFSPVVSGGGSFSVLVDPQGAVRESNEGNNAAAIFVPIPAYY